MNNVRWGRVGLFLLITFALCWGLAAVSYAGGVRWSDPRRAMALGTLFMMGPGVTAFLLQAYAFKEDAITTLGLKPVFNHVMPVAVAAPLLLAFSSMALALLLPGVSFSQDSSGLLERMGQSLPPDQLEKVRESLQGVGGGKMMLMLTLQALAAGSTVNALVAMGEEAGWRGFLQRELAPLGFWRSSALVGVVWGVWHAPLIIQGHNYPQHPELGVLLMVVFTTLLAPLLAWVRVESQTTWGPAVAHGVLNGCAGLAIVLLRGGDDLTVGVTGLSGMAVLVLFNGLLWKLGAPDARKTS